MKKGFTLVEVVAVIVLIGIISIIAVNQVFKMSDDSASLGRSKLEEQIKAAAYSYINDDKTIKYNIRNKNGSDTITFRELADNDYLSGDNLINPITKKEINLSSSTVKVEYNTQNLEYKYTINIVDK